jgi:hypothetical protein
MIIVVVTSDAPMIRGVVTPRRTKKGLMTTEPILVGEIK